MRTHSSVERTRIDGKEAIDAWLVAHDLTRGDAPANRSEDEGCGVWSATGVNSDYCRREKGHVGLHVKMYPGDHTLSFWVN